MLVNEFSQTCQLYTNFQIWEIKNMADFFNGSEILAAIFKDVYSISVEEFEAKKGEFEDSNFEIINNLLRLVDNK